MNKNRLAVILLGNHNSGKTATIKYFEKKYDKYGRYKRTCRSGWRHLQLYKEKSDALFTLMYFVPASPTETRNPLKNRLKDFKPELLLISEQINGKEYDNTINFLNSNDYEIVTFELTRKKPENIWGEWNWSNKDEILDQRAALIGNEFRNFILGKIATNTNLKEAN